MKRKSRITRKLLALLIALAMIVPSSLTNVFAVSEDPLSSLVQNTLTDTTGDENFKKLDKKARALNDDGLFEIELKVEGKKKTKTNKVDVVFVLDNSGSMSSDNVTKANAAIKDFMNTLVPGSSDSNIRFGLKTYSDSIKKTVNLTSNKSSISSQLPSSSTGGTHTQLGLREGNSLFDSSTSKKYIVLLTDGVPTYSDKVKTITDTDSPIPLYGEGHSGDYGSIQGNSYDGRVGSGSNYKLSGSSQYDLEKGKGKNKEKITVMDNGFATISQARAIRSSGIEIFGIAMNLTNSNQGISAANSKNVIRDIASEGKFFDVEDMETLSTVLGEIANTVGGTIVDGHLVDPMSQYVDVVKSGGNLDYTITTSPADLSKPTVTWDETSKTINITDIDLGENQFFTLKYKVQLKEEYKDGEFHDLNGTTTVYPGPSKDKGKDINVPKGKAYKADMELTKVADRTEFKVGEIINYTIKLENTGGRVLKDIVVNDPLLGGI